MENIETLSKLSRESQTANKMLMKIYERTWHPIRCVYSTWNLGERTKWVYYVYTKYLPSTLKGTEMYAERSARCLERFGLAGVPTMVAGSSVAPFLFSWCCEKVYSGEYFVEMVSLKDLLDTS